MKKQIAALKDPAMKKQMQQVLDMTVQMQAQANSPEGQKSTKETMDLMQKKTNLRTQVPLAAAVLILLRCNFKIQVMRS